MLIEILYYLGFQMFYFMKAVIIGLLALGAVQLLHAQNIFNNEGTTVVISALTDIDVGGGVSNTNTGVISMQETFYLTGNWNQDIGSSYTGVGRMWFNGGANQRITGAFSVPKIRVDNGLNLFLDNNVTAAVIDLNNNGRLVLGANDLTMAEIAGVTPASINNFDASNFIVTNSSGVLKRTVAPSGIYSGGQIFPVGNSSYNPVVVGNRDF